MKPDPQNQDSSVMLNQGDVENEKIQTYEFLKEMYDDSYFPNFLVDKGKAILIELCLQIESQNPKQLDDLSVVSGYKSKIVS